MSIPLKWFSQASKLEHEVGRRLPSKLVIDQIWVDLDPAGLNKSVLSFMNRLPMRVAAQGHGTSQHLLPRSS
jgi:hypothetical protein